MPLDKAKYKNLESRFKEQVERDRAFIIERVVQGWGVYLPSAEPPDQVDYIFVAMEPSFHWADNIEEAEKKIKEGALNFGGSVCPCNPESTLDLFICSIQRHLCQDREKYHLTDVSKGAMPGTVAAVDRDRRYERWYHLLLEEIAIVGKPDAPVVAIGKKVEQFLRGKELSSETNRPLYAVPHYSSQAFGFFRQEAEKDPAGFEAFEKEEFCENGRWPVSLSPAKKRLVFVYKKHFDKIRSAEQQVSD